MNLPQLAEWSFWILLFLAVIQAVLAAIMFTRLYRFRRTLLADADCPPAAVILCLRGSDPFLVRCLEAVFAQDYPQFELRIVVDHPSDPSLPIVEKVLAQHSVAGAVANLARDWANLVTYCPRSGDLGYKETRVVLQFLAQPLETCSLKCSSLVQAVAGCDDTIAFVAQLDADTIPHRTWLRELATALAPDDVGAANGNRWYIPDVATCGALVRCLWNAAAVVQMYLFRIAWGGTLAIKTRVIREAGLVDRWSRAFCEDTMLFSVLRRQGWKVAFVPSLMMINRETCNMPSFRAWVRRQLLTARLYHPLWPCVVIHGFGTSAAQIATILLLLVSLALRDARSAAMAAAGLGIYHLSMFFLLMPLDWVVRRIAVSRPEAVRRLTFAQLLKTQLSIPLTQLVYPWTLLMAMRLRQVEWRGVTYEINSPWEVKLVEYRPYGESSGEVVASAMSL